MNGSLTANAELLSAVVAGAAGLMDVELVVCPPFVYLSSAAAALKGSAIGLGAQNLSEHEKAGAYTGEVLGSMLVEVGCDYVIVGHSERRSYYGETSELVARKTRSAIAAGLKPIVCVGETLAERDGGRTGAVLRGQIAAVLDSGEITDLADMVIAYEPVWAIGTGRTATPEQAQEAHALLRSEVRARDARLADSMRILYGGSVKADNAASLFGGDVDGGLIGGASLKASDFLAIAGAAS